MIKSWMAIAVVIFIISLGANIFLTPSDIKWFKQLRRPRWLTFEALIPVVWTVVFICGGISAYLIWEKEVGSSRGWLMMSFYLLLEVVIIAYVPITLKLRSPTLGTWVGLTGFGMGVALSLEAWQISGWAAVFLLPYLVWSPIGSYTTWAIARLNP